MFESIRGKAINFSTDDLDKCIDYLSIEASAIERQLKATQIASTIRHWLEQIYLGKSSQDNVLEHFKKQKNVLLSQLGPNFYKNVDGGATYICWCFFVFALSHENAASKAGMNKIFNLCEVHSDPGARAAVQEIISSLRKDFKIPASTKSQSQIFTKNNPPTANATTVIRCPKCQQQCRVPTQKALEITCPKCRNSWIQST